MALVGIEDFSSLCRMIYFPTEDCPQAIFAIVNAGLYDLFMEECCLADDVEQRDQYHAYAKMARANLETYLANLPMFLSAKIENVQALLLGVGFPLLFLTVIVFCRLTNRPPVPICHRRHAPLCCLASQFGRCPDLPDGGLSPRRGCPRRASSNKTDQRHPLLASILLGPRP